MSALANYLETLRVKKNLTLEESAKRSNMAPASYRQREKQPEKVPLYILVSIVNALAVKDEEFVEFSMLTSRQLRD